MIETLHSIELGVSKDSADDPFSRCHRCSSKPLLALVLISLQRAMDLNPEAFLDQDELQGRAFEPSTRALLNKLLLSVGDELISPFVHLKAADWSYSMFYDPIGEALVDLNHSIGGF